MEYLTQPVTIDTGAVLINIRLLLNDKQKNIIIIVTDNEDKKRKPLTNYPYHYSNFNKEESEIKEHIKRSLENDYITHTPQDIETLINDLKSNMGNKVKASVNFPKDNVNFNDIYLNCLNESKGKYNNNENYNNLSPQKIIREILNNNYQDIIKQINKGEIKELVLDCNDFDITINMGENTIYPLTDFIKQEPKKFIELVNNELKNLIHEKPPSSNPYEDKEDDEIYYLRLKNFEETPLKYMLSDKVGKFTQTKGVITGIYPARPQIKKAVFECRGCMRLYEVEQEDELNLIEPSLCSECGGRSFRIILSKSTYTNKREILLTELQEDLNLDDQPRQLLVNLKGNKDFITNVNAGVRVNITGILDSIPLGKDNKKQFVYNSNYIEKLDDKTTVITKEDNQKYLELSKEDDILELLINSFAPDLILPREVKLGILCYLVKSGVDLDGLDMIHILIISDPAMAKSKLKKRTHELTEKGVLASGTGASGVGLTGAVVKDPITNNWVLTAGAIPLANKGHCIIDEIDKMSKEDTTHANNFMESGHEEFNKAGVNASLKGETGILALGNPKFGRYDPYKSLQDQVNIDPSFQSRFDLIFLLPDKPDEIKDSEIMDSILDSYTPKIKGTHIIEESDILVTEDLKKYLAFARNGFNPTLSQEAKNIIKTYGLNARKSNETENESPYNWRFARSIIKLSGAFAKLHLRGTITPEDVKEAINLKEFSIKTIGLDPITNTIDNDRVTGNLNKEDKRERDIITQLIKDYVQDPNHLDCEGIPSKILLNNFKFETSKSRNTFYRRLRELKNAGEIIETGKGKNKQYKLK